MDVERRRIRILQVTSESSSSYSNVHQCELIKLVGPACTHRFGGNNNNGFKLSSINQLDITHEGWVLSLSHSVPAPRDRCGRTRTYAGRTESANMTRWSRGATGMQDESSMDRKARAHHRPWTYIHECLHLARVPGLPSMAPPGQATAFAYSFPSGPAGRLAIAYPSRNEAQIIFGSFLSVCIYYTFQRKKRERKRTYVQ